ncbi:CDP-glucose 4,6-dehydratase [Alphaproteobacteria bacterium]|nr:CDP-glucose 4,6-dehydratase [Alphaproteobacteria bacterium]
MLDDFYRNKKVFITGNTGFKGSWLTAWLLRLGANVVGFSCDIPTSPSMHEIMGHAKGFKQYFDDVADSNRVAAAISREKPDIIFHLAAQAIVTTSYTDPLNTIKTNVMGTTNVLEALRIIDRKCIAVIITSDKVYDNVEQIWGYRENDALGGKDTYSGSKGAAELIVKSYFNSFFKAANSKVRLATARAGNVIGGGDWSKDRIVVDIINSWENGSPVTIRNPEATRPWQHVLEPLGGYLTLGKALASESSLSGENFNFGPVEEQNVSVANLIKEMAKNWTFTDSVVNKYLVESGFAIPEAKLLKLNCDKARTLLKWHSICDFEATIKMTVDWYQTYFNRQSDIKRLTEKQIEEYQKSMGF